MADLLGEGAGVVLVVGTEYQVFPTAYHRAALRLQPLSELDRLTMRWQLNVHFPSGLPGCEGLLSLSIDQALMLRRSLLAGIRHRDARVLPVFFQRMPAVERELRAQLVPCQHLAHHPVRLAGRVLGTGIEKDGGTIDGHRDAVTEPTAHVVFHLVLANGPNRLLDVGLIAERDGHPPVICHDADSTARPPVVAQRYVQHQMV